MAFTISETALHLCMMRVNSTEITRKANVLLKSQY